MSPFNMIHIVHKTAVALLVVGLLVASTGQFTWSQAPAVRFVPSNSLRNGVDDFAAASEPALADPCQLMTPLSGISLRRGQVDEPQDYAASSFQAPACAEDDDVLTRSWQASQFRWASSAFAHRPLYFEDVNLERHGLSFGIAQPVVSAAHFFGNVLALPYHVIDQHPHQCVYDLGHCRPGSCVPYYHYRSALNPRAGLAEAGTIVGLVFLIP